MGEKTLGELIAEKRRERHMTQAALAAHFGISDKAVSKWERNLSRPEGNHMANLVELLDLPREYLPTVEPSVEKEYLPPYLEPTYPSRHSEESLVNKAHSLSARDVISITATAVLLALSVCTSTGFLAVEQSVPIMGGCNAMLAWGMLWRGAN